MSAMHNGAMGETVNEDGTLVYIEAVYYRYYSVEAEECDSIEEALSFLEGGEDYGNLAGVGVFVDGLPVRVFDYGSPSRPPRADEVEAMREDYAKVRR